MAMTKIDMTEILKTMYDISIKLNLIDIVDNSTRRDYCEAEDSNCMLHPMKTPQELALEANQDIMNFLTKHGLGYHHLSSNPPTGEDK